MKIKIEFNADNAAFEDNLSLEIREVLERAANVAVSLVTGDGGYCGLRDSNGNSIGTVEVVEE